MKKLTEGDEKRWQSAEDNFRQIRLNYYNRKKKKICQSRHEGNLYDENQISHIICTQTDSQSLPPSTTTQSSISNTVIVNENDHFKKDEINSFITDDDSIQLNDIRKVCDQFVWNIVESDSNVFLLTRYLISNTIICSISNIDPDMSYQHICQYVLDFCFGNDICGKHGRCINTLVASRCSCYLYMDGPICDKTFNWCFYNYMYFHYIKIQTTSEIPKTFFQKAQRPA
ncbi:unnamed protein product [Rotaria sordida]|uniref:EGF-like domain-containing protein n=1 Tax=Rotaria sordida TaxID=392033 RepID=A0A814ZN68_9BILA|nr:unnamed protein product [Rotaria sordida]